MAGSAMGAIQEDEDEEGADAEEDEAGESVADVPQAFRRELGTILFVTANA